MNNTTIAHKILMAVICVLLFVCGSVLTYFLISLDRKTDAFSSTYTETDNAVVVGELWNGNKTSGSFNTANVKKFIQMLSNSTTGTVDTLSSQVDDSQPNNQGIKLINATTLREYSSAGNVANKSIVVTLGGYKWVVTCVSKDSNGSVVATLWADDAHSRSTFGDGSFRGANDFFTDLPTGMYGSSHMRAVTLNNGGQYVHITSDTANPTTADLVTVSSTIDHVYGAFTHSTGALYKYITQPNQMPYQTNAQGRSNNGIGYILMNESLATDLIGYNKEFNFQNKTPYYTNWGTDKLWLPSLAETGYNATYTGIWKTSQAERSNSVIDVWLRSCSQENSRGIFVILPSGNEGYNYGVQNNNAVRPALHLDLVSIVSEVANSITLNKQEGTGGSNSVYVWQGETTMPEITPPTREGYTFGGYYSGVNGAGDQYYSATGASLKSFSTSTPKTLYAKWVPITYQIKYNGNGNTGGGMVNSSHTYDTAKALSANGFVKTGYGFTGWATSANGAVVYQDKESIKNLANTSGAIVNLYAKWAPGLYVVTFEYNGATGGNSTATKSVTFDAPYGTLPAPTKAGSSFAGWYLESTFATQVRTEAVVSQSSNHTLYARWITWVTVSATGDNIEFVYQTKLDEDDNYGKVTITPRSKFHVSEFSLDNVTYFQAKYYSQALGKFAFGHAFCAIDDASDKISFTFEYLDVNYVKSHPISIYIKIASGSNGSLIDSAQIADGVNVTATYGGTARIVGDNFEDLGDSDLVTFIADVCVEGYEFSHWENAAGENLGTDNSIRLTKSVVMNNIIKAVFVLSDNILINGDKNNQ